MFWEERILASSGAVGEDVSVASRSYGDYSYTLYIW